MSEAATLQFDGKLDGKVGGNGLRLITFGKFGCGLPANVRQCHALDLAKLLAVVGNLRNLVATDSDPLPLGTFDFGLPADE